MGQGIYANPVAMITRSWRLNMAMCLALAWILVLLMVRPGSVIIDGSGMEGKGFSKHGDLLERFNREFRIQRSENFLGEEKGKLTLEGKEEEEVETCKPVTKIGFFKMYKCGSTTVQVLPVYKVCM